MSSEYAKQLEETIELLKKKFEDYSIEVDSIKEYLWNDLTYILPKQEGGEAFCLVYTMAQAFSVGLTMGSKDYRNCYEDIVTPNDVWNVIYNKRPSRSLSFMDEVKQCGDTSKKVEIVRTLYLELLKESNRISDDIHRGAGNVVVVSSDVAALLSLLAQFEGGGTNKNRDGFRIYKFGTIGRFSVYVDSKNTTNKAVVIYRGDKENDGSGVILNNNGIYHWFRPDGYDNYWNIIDLS